MSAPFHKYHGLGNDYIVLDPKDWPGGPPSAEAIEAICARSTGVGADGVLYGPIIQEGAHHLRIFNSDGSEAEKSGNGLRIFGQYLLDQAYVRGPQFTVHTLAGQIEIEVLGPNTLKVAMGGYSPLIGEVFEHTLEVQGRTLAVHAVDLGNPHAVCFDLGADPQVAKDFGPELEQHSLFPNKTNCQFAKVLDRSNLQIAIWERGSGYTLASGSSSTAAACMAHHLGLCDNQISVQMPGGELQVVIEDSSQVYLSGPVGFICSGQFSESFYKERIHS